MYRYRPETQDRSELSRRTTSAIGLLSRLYLGWRPDTGPLALGISRLDGWLQEEVLDWNKAKSLSKNSRRRDLYFSTTTGAYRRSLYFDYYAILLLHHCGGSAWQRSFPPLRDFLVETQASGQGNSRPHEKGSWLFEDEYLNKGGRLLNTVLALLILETPYRYLPLYPMEQPM